MIPHGSRQNAGMEDIQTQTNAQNAFVQRVMRPPIAIMLPREICKENVRIITFYSSLFIMELIVCKLISLFPLEQHVPANRTFC
jgi:hypothetical protein